MIVCYLLLYSRICKLSTGQKLIRLKRLNVFRISVKLFFNNFMDNKLCFLLHAKGFFVFLWIQCEIVNNCSICFIRLYCKDFSIDITEFFLKSVLRIRNLKISKKALTFTLVCRFSQLSIFRLVGPLFIPQLRLLCRAFHNDDGCRILHTFAKFPFQIILRKNWKKVQHLNIELHNSWNNSICLGFENNFREWLS